MISCGLQPQGGGVQGVVARRRDHKVLTKKCLSLVSIVYIHVPHWMS